MSWSINSFLLVITYQYYNDNLNLNYLLLDRLPLYSRRWSCVIYGKMEYYINIFIKDFDKLESTTNNIDRVVGYTYLETNNGRPFFMIFWWKIQGSGMRAVHAINSLIWLGDWSCKFTFLPYTDIDWPIWGFETNARWLFEE